MREQNAVVVDRKDIADDIVRLAVRPEIWEPIVPGQFAHLAVEGTFLRRPISIAGTNETAGTLDLIVQKVGSGTRRLAESREGTVLKMLSPLGRGFEGPWKAGRKIWLVGGGVGVAPLILLACRLYTSDCRVESFIGFRDEKYAYGALELRQYGRVRQNVGGFVTDLLRERLRHDRPDLIATCGPTPMMKAIQAVCLEHTIEGRASLEEYMGCGLGACLVCNCKIKIKNGFAYRRVCADGPVFDISEVIFDA